MITFLGSAPKHLKFKYHENPVKYKKVDIISKSFTHIFSPRLKNGKIEKMNVQLNLPDIIWYFPFRNNQIGNTGKCWTKLFIGQRILKQKSWLGFFMRIVLHYVILVIYLIWSILLFLVGFPDGLFNSSKISESVVLTWEVNNKQYF